MNELASPGVDADMVDLAATGAEENQVARLHLLETDGVAGLALLGSGAGKGNAIGISVYVLCQAAAIKAFSRCFTTILVTYTQNLMGL